MKMIKKYLVIALAIILFGSTTLLSHAATFFDDFNDGNADGWWLGYSLDRPSAFGNWRIENGSLTQDAGGDSYVALVEDLQLSDQTVETDIKLNQVSGYGGVVVWLRDASNWVLVRLYPAAGGIRFEERIDGVTFKSSYMPYSTQNGVWYNMMVEADSTSGNVTVYIDDNHAYTYTFTTPNRLGQSGVVSGNSGGYFDNFSLTDTSTSSTKAECSEATICGEACSYGGVTYNTVLIGTQCWFKENLNAGTMIGNLETPDDTAPTLNDPNTASKWCYDDSSTYCDNEGGLYTWAEINALPHSCNYGSCSVPTPNQGICPAGWHVPSDEEFHTLENYLTTPGQTCDSARLSWDCFGAGTKLILGGSSGFDAIGAGNHETNGDLSFFDKREPSVHFWSSSPASIGEGYAYTRSLIYLYTPGDMVFRGWGRGIHGLSARCLADTTYGVPPIGVAIDIRPWSKRNLVRHKGRGILPVAILSTEDFDAPSQIDKESLTFGANGDEQSLAFCSRRPRDIRRDGSKDDLVCYFFMKKAGFQCGDTEGVLMGETVDGIPIEGRDSVKVIRCK